MSKFRDSLFQRLFAIIAFIALISVWLDLKALFLSDGLAAFKLMNLRFNGINAFLKFPSVFAFNSSDWFVYLILGLAASVLVLLASYLVKNRFLRSSLFLIFYLSYLSFVNFGDPFMNFQWDILLLEASFLFSLYFFFSQDTNLAKINIWFFRILVFKLMLMSGLVKIFSGDETWLNFSALEYHYFTQPLPNFLSFFVHQAPSAFHKLSCALMFAIELIFPFFIFFGKKLREFAGWAFIILQVVIFLTGNYGFFNLLTIVLCFSLFEFQSNPSSFGKFKFNKSFRYLSIVLISLYSLISLSLICSRVTAPALLIKPAQVYYEILGGYHLCNPYGLFAMMTKKRGEIVIQGGRNIPGELGVEWKDYKFKFKPQDLKLIPLQIAPLQPRLDWQMWFAALSTYQRNPWFIKLVEKLLRNDQNIIDLLAENPFEKSAPDVIRALYFEYEFNDFSSYLKTKEVWTRKYSRVYLPEISLRK